MQKIKSYATVTVAYWSFTLTDGALRMLVLLHFHTLGYTPIQLAFLFLFYELMGIVTNLVGGWIASQMGLRITLLTGLLLQVSSLLALSKMNSDWSETSAIIYVFCVQGLSGVAKDLTKLSSKSAIKLLVPDHARSKLFKWVAILTGSKNALKGIGFFLGGVFLSLIGFERALWLMAGVLFTVLIFVIRLLPKDISSNLAKTKFTSVITKSPQINLLSSARAFLFGSRDVWFVVGLPIFLYDVMQWRFESVSGFFAIWIIGYGLVQVFAPNILKNSESSLKVQITSLKFWTFGLLGLTCSLSVAIFLSLGSPILVLSGVCLFGFLFALNSSLHSYLILALTKADHVALNVGFYYMANAIGRLFGTFLSGLAYQTNGLLGCMIFASIMIFFSGICALKLRRIVKTEY